MAGCDNGMISAGKSQKTAGITVSIILAMLQPELHDQQS
jgi:hypothetical protein